MKALSIVIPCYNEAKNIPLILDKFKNLLKDRTDIEVVLVDNGSFDNSAEVIQNLIPMYNFAVTTKVKVNQGYGFGILAGLKIARGDFLGWTHADLQTDPKDVLKAWDITKHNNYNSELFVKGLRKSRPIFDVFFTVGMSLFESLFLKTKLWDINAQPNIFHRNFYQSWKNPPYDFSLDLYALYMARKEKIKIMRFDVLFTKRIHGQSSWNTGFKAKWKFIKRTIGYSLKLKRELNEVYSPSNKHD